MKEPFSFGAPERRRFAMQFGYDMRPSFWQEVRSNSHLVIAAVGTAALLGVAAVALWLALPSSEKQAAASTEQSIPTIPVKTTKISPSGTTVAVAAAVPQVERKSSKVSPAMAVAQAAIPALAANDPRWTASQAKAASAPATASPDPAAKQAEQAPDKPVAFAQPAAGTFGQQERNLLRNPGYWGWDMGLRKNFPVTERQRLQFRFEVFNILNHPNWNGANTNPTSGAFGQVTSKSGERNLQLALKYIF